MKFKEIGRRYHALAAWRTWISLALSVLILAGASPCFAGKGTSFGTNVYPSLYYIPDNMYVDMFNHSTGWWNNGTTITLNAEGYPVSGAAQNLIETGGWPSGDYLFSGEGNFSFLGDSPMLSGTLQTVNNVTTGVMHVDVPPPESPQGELLFTIGVNDPNNLPRNFHLMEPGYAMGTKAIFSKQYLQALQPFTTLRMMDWMNTNGSTVTTWASRPQPGFFGCGGSGICYERFIALANATNRDLWINIPLHATDDWAVNMANLLKTTLKPGLHCYIELSNELWNWGFSANWWTIETWDQTNPALTQPQGSWARHGQQVAYSLMHFIRIMQPIMGSQARFVLSGQFVDPLYCSSGLAWIQDNCGPPASYLFAISGAPYFGGTGTDLDSVFASINASIASTAPQLQQNVALANQYGVKYVCYESGQGLGAWDNASAALFAAAQQDPRMATAYYNYAQIMNQAGVYLCNFYNFIMPWGWGYWGAAQDVRQTVGNPSVKYAAEAAIANAGSQNINSVRSNSSSQLTKAEEKAEAKAAEARARAAAEAAKHNKK